MDLSVERVTGLKLNPPSADNAAVLYGCVQPAQDSDATESPRVREHQVLHVSGTEAKVKAAVLSYM